MKTASSGSGEDEHKSELARAPDDASELHRLSVVHLQRGEYEEAAALLLRLIALDPSLPDAHNNLGVALQALERSSEALRHFEMAAQLAPKRAGTHYNLGRALDTLGRRAEARECYERALALKPDYSEAHNSLGMVLAANDPERALAHFQRAVASNPDYADAHSNTGNALSTLGRIEEALASYRKAIAIRPDHTEAQNNLGMALWGLNRHEEALARFELAQAIRPDYVEAHLNEGLVRLTLGDYATGWKKYAWRRLTPSFSQGRQRPPRPLWLGQWDIADKTILLHGEQGLGDTILFSRYVPAVARRGARVILAVQQPLAALMAGLEGVSVLRAKGEAIPPHDGFCPLPSLPLTFATTLETIPAEVPYLTAPADRLLRWRPIMEALGQRRVGVMWSGSLQSRAIPLDLLLPLLDLPGLTWVALHKEVREQDQPLLATTRMATFLGDSQADLADTAAMIATLDLVITVDTVIAHLAGALGKPVWILLPFSADWRWLRYREDSPWYPTARLFRQTQVGDWAAVVEQVRAALKTWHAGGKNREI